MLTPRSSSYVSPPVEEVSDARFLKKKVVVYGQCKNAQKEYVILEVSSTNLLAREFPDLRLGVLPLEQYIATLKGGLTTMNMELVRAESFDWEESFKWVGGKQCLQEPCISDCGDTDGIQYTYTEVDPSVCTALNPNHN